MSSTTTEHEPQTVSIYSPKFEQAVHEAQVEEYYHNALRSLLGVEEGAESPAELTAFIDKLKSEDLAVRANAERGLDKFMHDIDLQAQETPMDFSETKLAPSELKDILDGLTTDIASAPDAKFHIELDETEQAIAGKLLEKANHFADEDKYGKIDMTSHLGSLWDAKALNEIAGNLTGIKEGQALAVVEKVYKKLADSAPRYFDPKVTEDSSVELRDLLDQKYPGALDPQDPVNMLMRAIEASQTTSPESLKAEKVDERVRRAEGKVAVADTNNNAQETLLHNLQHSPEVDKVEDFSAKKIDLEEMTSLFAKLHSDLTSSKKWNDLDRANAQDMLNYVLNGEQFKKAQNDGDAVELSLDDVWSKAFMRKFELKHKKNISWEALRKHMVKLIEQDYNEHIRARSLKK